ncbi:hypothetical protein CHUAL_002329 [Chamberlinius hualienensis]
MTTTRSQSPSVDGHPSAAAQNVVVSAASNTDNSRRSVTRAASERSYAGYAASTNRLIQPLLLSHRHHICSSFFHTNTPIGIIARFHNGGIHQEWLVANTSTRLSITHPSSFPFHCYSPNIQ